LRAKGIEQTILKDNNGVTAAYKAKIRSLFVNLKDKNNPTLRERVVSGDLPVERFCKMTSQVHFRLTPFTSAIWIIMANVFTLDRKWLLMRGKPQTPKSWKITCISHLAHRNKELKPKGFNVTVASR
jgi:hypothetical protein